MTPVAPRRAITPDEYRSITGQAPKARKRTEEILQTEVVAWLNGLEATDFIFTHPANERKSKIETLRAMRLGQRSGTPDLVFWLSGGKTLQIEMKVPGTYQNENQRKFEFDLKSLGHPYAVCRSIEEVRKALLDAGAIFAESYPAKVLRLGSDAYKP